MHSAAMFFHICWFSALLGAVVALVLEVVSLVWVLWLIANKSKRGLARGPESR